jgi:hypothetical protein
VALTTTLRRTGRMLGVLLCALVLPGVCAAQQAAAPAAAAVPSVRAVSAAGRIVIDGRLDESDWQRAEPAADFIQRDPDEGRPAPQRTEVRVLYDADAIYFGARMFDREPGRIVRRLTRRDADAAGVADSLVIGIDPHHDHLTGAWFTVTAAGCLADGTLFNDSGQDNLWDGVWDAAVSIDDQGWTAEIRIPFSQLRFPASERQAWGIDFVRTTTRTNGEDWWAPAPKKDSATVSRFGHLTGLDGIQVRRHLDVLPYVTARGESSSAAEPGDPFASGRSATGGLGLDVKWGLSSNITMDGTINPDFGQVEVDPAVVNLSAFETFYDEKRPFFIEGSDVFSRFGRNGASGFMGFNRSNPTLFYSRRIGRAPQGSAGGDFVDMPSATTILGAAKITGKTARGWTVNFIDAVTSREWADTAIGTSRDRVEVEPLTNYAAARVRRDIGTRAGVGALATLVNRDLRDTGLRASLADAAYVLGGDGHLFLDRGRDYVVTGAFSASYLSGASAAISRLQRASARYFQRPDATHLTYDPASTTMAGWNLQTDFTRNRGSVRPNASFWAVSPGYQVNDVGYMTTADRMGMHAGVVWLKPTPDRFSRSRNLVAAMWYVWNFAHEKMSNGAYLSGSATFRNYWSASAQLIATADALSDRLTRGGPMMAARGGQSYSGLISTDSRKALVMSVNGAYETGRDGSWWSTGSATVTFKPMPAVTLEAGPAITRGLSVAQYVRTVADPAAAATYGSRYVFGSIDQTEWSMTTRVNVMLSPRMSLQIYAQPLLSVGRYGDFKEAARPRTFDFVRYGQDAGSIAYDAAAGAYLVQPDGGGARFAMPNPDFNFKSLRVNAVYRWEFKPGSSFYLVWTQQREDYARPGLFGFNQDISSLMRAPSDNIVMAKVSYWFSR